MLRTISARVKLRNIPEERRSNLGTVIPLCWSIQLFSTVTGYQLGCGCDTISGIIGVCSLSGIIVRDKYNK